MEPVTGRERQDPNDMQSRKKRTFRGCVGIVLEDEQSKITMEAAEQTTLTTNKDA